MAQYETETRKLFGPGGHDFNTFFRDRLIGLDDNTKNVLKELTEGAWFTAQDIAKNKIKSDQDRLSYCQSLKNDGYIQPFVNCNEAIYDEDIYFFMYKTLAGDILIENAKNVNK